MPSSFIYKTYRTSGLPETVQKYLAGHFLSKGMVKTDESPSGAVTFFRYPSLFFSSKRPLSCISRLSLETRGDRDNVHVRIGATFTKIKYFNMFMMAFIWFGAPVLMGVVKSASPNFSPLGCLIVPAGILMHYMVRGRVFRYLKASVEQAGREHGFHR